MWGTDCLLTSNLCCSAIERVYLAKGFGSASLLIYYMFVHGYGREPLVEQCVHVYTHACVYMHVEARDQVRMLLLGNPSTLFLETVFFTGTRSSTIRLGWLVREFLDISACLPLPPSAGITTTHYHVCFSIH